LKLPARGRDKELGVAHPGKPAFGSFMKHGDAILLFIDPDQNYFNSEGVTVFNLQP
jgi:hypothetical protein